MPVLATGAAATMVLLAPQQFSGTAYVAAPALVGGAAGTQYTGTQAANQFVAAFGAAVTSPGSSPTCPVTPGSRRSGCATGWPSPRSARAANWR
ncbi:hypothetical protein NKG94_14965 [Micromonospora sp. M12]